MVFILVQLCVSLCFVCEGSPTFPLELEIFFCHIVVPKLFLSLCCTAEMGKDFEALVLFLIDVEKKKNVVCWNNSIENISFYPRAQTVICAPTLFPCRIILKSEKIPSTCP